MELLEPIYRFQLAILHRLFSSPGRSLGSISLTAPPAIGCCASDFVCALSLVCDEHSVRIYLQQ